MVVALVATAIAMPSGAVAAVPHLVQPGETLWSIAAANNFTTRTVAVYNGLPEDAYLIAGTTVYVPTIDEGVAALAAGTAAVSPPPSAGGGDASASTSEAEPASADSGPAGSGVLGSIAPAPGMGHVPSPYGDLHLIPAAANAWNAMRQEALSTYGVDLYPGGPVSAYRTYDQQAALYGLFLDGTGAPANPPGASSHELGTAVDVPTPEMRSVIDQIGWKYGWGKVHAPGEWWHVDYIGG
jgi:LysM repeat protein